MTALSGTRFNLERMPASRRRTADVRAPLPDSLSSWIVFGLFALVAVAWLVWRAANPGRTAEGADCIQRYATARTVADSALVDASYPRTSDPRQAMFLTCETLRKAGQLRR